MSRRTKFPGFLLDCGGRDQYIVAPLTLKQMKTNREVIGAFLDFDAKFRSGAPINPVDVTEKAAPLILIALQRNHPDMTLDKVEEMVDMHNFQTLMPAIMGGSGFVPVSVIPEGVAVEQAGE